MNLSESCNIPTIENLVVYTSTFYDNSEESKIRSKLCLKFLRNLNDLGIPCIVAEGGSKNESFLEEVKKIPNITIINTNEGMGKDRRNGLEKAINNNQDKKYFLWSEPEKDALMTGINLTILTDYAELNNLDIVVPKRKKGDGRPKFQKWIEARANKKIHNSLEKDILDLSPKGLLDLWFGPKLFNRKGAKYFLNYTSDLDKWDAIIKPVVNGLKDGLKVGSIEIEYKYDPTQVENEGEENKDIMKKRIEQYRLIIKEILGKDTPTL